MAIDIDGLAVLRAIAENPLAFQDVTMEINEAARTLVLKQLKSKTTLERLHHALGGEALALILDGLGDTPSATLVKIDKDNPELKTASPEWCRNRLADLASVVAEPVAKPTPVTPKKEPKGKKPVRSPEQKALATTLKARTTNLAKARELWREIGESSFMLILDDLTPLQKTTLAKKLDKDNSYQSSKRQRRIGVVNESPISRAAAPSQCSKAFWIVRRWRRNGRVSRPLHARIVKHALLTGHRAAFQVTPAAISPPCLSLRDKQPNSLALHRAVPIHKVLPAGLHGCGLRHAFALGGGVPFVLNARLSRL